MAANKSKKVKGFLEGLASLLVHGAASKQGRSDLPSLPLSLGRPVGLPWLHGWRDSQKTEKRDQNKNFQHDRKQYTDG